MVFANCDLLVWCCIIQAVFNGFQKGTTMTTHQTVMRISGLTELEKLTLEEQIQPNQITFQSQPIEDDRHGELLTTTAIVVITVAALQGLTAWLLKTSRRDMIEKTIEIVHPDGGIEKTTIKIDLSSSE